MKSLPAVKLLIDNVVTQTCEKYERPCHKQRAITLLSSQFGQECMMQAAKTSEKIFRAGLHVCALTARAKACCERLRPNNNQPKMQRMGPFFKNSSPLKTCI